MSKPATPPPPWTPDEAAWALECLRENDTVAEMAGWSNRDERDVRAELLRQGAPASAVAVAAGVSPQAVRAAAKRRPWFRRC